MVQCKVCLYPYYVTSAGNCLLGASLLCENGASGLSRY